MNIVDSEVCVLCNTVCVRHIAVAVIIGMTSLIKVIIEKKILK